MKKVSLRRLAVSGLLSGCFVVQALEGVDAGSHAGKKVDSNLGNLGYSLMSENELLFNLNDEGYKTYMGLSKEGKLLAREVASARCDGTNECKGLNACKTDKNDCGGKGSCKGTGKCGFSDKNLAVKVVAKKMAEKRSQAAQLK